MSEAAVAFERSRQFWHNTARTKGEGYVGRTGESHELQRRRIEDLLRSRISADSFYTDVLDFGCGYGRFIPFWSEICGHVWAVDLLPDMLKRAKGKSKTVTALQANWPFRLPMQEPQIDLLWTCFALQHVTDDGIFTETMQELRRVLKPQARVLMLENAVDHSHHIKPRKPQYLAELLGLQPGWTSDLVTVNNRPRDHWLLDGVKA